MRQLLARCLGGATAFAAAAFVTVSIYGLTRGPAAPIHPSAGGFRDRLGNRYTAAQYADHLLWKQVFFGAGAAVFLLGFGWMAVSEKERRKPGELSPEGVTALHTAAGILERYLPDAAAELRAYGSAKQPSQDAPHRSPKSPPPA